MLVALSFHLFHPLNAASNRNIWISSWQFVAVSSYSIISSTGMPFLNVPWADTPTHSCLNQLPFWSIAFFWIRLVDDCDRLSINILRWLGHFLPFLGREDARNVLNVFSVPIRCHRRAAAATTATVAVGVGWCWVAIVSGLLLWQTIMGTSFMYYWWDCNQWTMQRRRKTTLAFRSDHCQLLYDAHMTYHGNRIEDIGA